MPTVNVDREGPVAVLRLNRPEKGNAINLEMAEALMKAAIEVDEDDSIRCVLLTGNGKLFCAGGDVSTFAAAGEHIPQLLKSLTGALHSAISRLARMEKPLITAVNGPAAGAGYSLALLGDIALAAPSASFRVAYPALGLSPDGGATWLLPRLVGLRSAQELMLTNRKVSADEAAVLGLVTRVSNADDFLEDALALARQISAQATGALGATRALLLQSYGATLETHLEVEARTISLRARSTESREGVAALLEKRNPDFSGAGRG